MAETLEKIVAITLLGIGASYVLHARLWSRYMLELFQQPHRILPLLWITLPLGLLIVLTHNTWTADLTVVVTLFGWILTIKAAGYLLMPQLATQVAAGWGEEGLRRHVVGVGAVLAVLGLVMTYQFFLIG
jgi:hypothetical protein